MAEGACLHPRRRSGTDPMADGGTDPMAEGTCLHPRGRSGTEDLLLPDLMAEGTCLHPRRMSGAEDLRCCNCSTRAATQSCSRSTAAHRPRGLQHPQGPPLRQWASLACRGIQHPLGPPQGHVLLQLRGALLLLALLLLRHGRAALSSELSMEAPLGLGAVAASSDSANSWTATMPLGLGSWGLGRGEPRFAVSTVITSPCADAACLRSSEITGHRCPGWPRGGLRALGDRLLL